MQKWLLRLLAFAAALIVAVLATGYGLLRASLPDLDGTLVVEHLDGAASIERDANGVPVITAGSRADLAFATGVAHGQDRYFQMDLIRRQAAGELAELFGPAAVDIDRYHRFHGFRAIAGQVLASLAVDERLVLERYAAGVNAGLASLAAQPFEYYVIHKKPAPWTAEDSLVVVYAMFMELNDERADRDLRHGLAKRVLPPMVYAWLYPDGTPWDAPILGDARPVAAWPAPEDYDLRDRARGAAAAAALAPARVHGSNNWAVSGALTASGRALVANDMHLGLSVPNIWYRARLVQTADGKRDLTGVSLPGTPLVVAGSNGRIAWGYHQQLRRLVRRRPAEAGVAARYLPHAGRRAGLYAAPGKHRGRRCAGRRTARTRNDLGPGGRGGRVSRRRNRGELDRPSSARGQPANPRSRNGEVRPRGTRHRKPDGPAAAELRRR